MINRDGGIIKKNGKRNWSIYNQLKTNRLQIFIHVLLLVLDSMPLPSLYRGRGRKPILLKDIVKCLAIKVYYQIS